MKFVSKILKYQLTLKHGMPGHPAMGIPPVPGVYVLFEQGQYFTEDEEIIKLLKSNKSFGVTYFAVEDEAKDPFAGQRRSSEPGHAIMEMGQGGTPGKAYSTPVVAPNAVRDAAEELLRKMMPDIVAKVRATVEAENAAKAGMEEVDKPAQDATVATRKPGRPKKTVEATEPVGAK